VAKADTTETTMAEAASAPRTESRWRVTINADPVPGGDCDVSLTINGRITQVKRNEPVYLTKDQLEVLENAAVRGYRVPSEGRVVAVKGVRRFSYVVHGEVQVPVGFFDTSPETETAPGSEAEAGFEAP